MYINITIEQNDPEQWTVCADEAYRARRWSILSQYEVTELPSSLSISIESFRDSMHSSANIYTRTLYLLARAHTHT